MHPLVRAFSPNCQYDMAADLYLRMLICRMHVAIATWGTAVQF